MRESKILGSKLSEIKNTHCYSRVDFLQGIRDCSYMQSLIRD